MSHNSTTDCRKHVAPNPPSLFQNGNLQFQTHHIGFILSGTFAIISTAVSFWLIRKHLQWYTNKREQRYIVRLLFMVPLYALISFASFYFWNQATPIVLVRDSYEAIVLTAFFYLLLTYISADPDEQRRIFVKRGLSRQADRISIQKGLPVQKWCFPLGFIKSKPSDGFYFLQLMKWAVLQYCVIRPATTLAAVILDTKGLYCESSWNPRWGHVHIVVIVSISVTVAMYCLVQLYVAVGQELAPHKPLLKFFSVKAVVFLTFWQATFLSLLSMVGVIKDTKYMTAEDITIGIGAVIETFEMMLFAFLHIRAFTYKPYRAIAVEAAKGRLPTRTHRWRSFGHAIDFRETFREIWIGCVYMLDKMRGKEPKPDFGARRIAHYEVAFGRSRFPQSQSAVRQHGEKRDKEATTTEPALPDVEIEVEPEGRRQWLGLSKYDRYYGLRPDREKSDGLEDQINHELERLGYPKHDSSLGVNSAVPLRPNRWPWWRTLYNRLSQTGQEVYEREGFVPRRLSAQFSHRNHSNTRSQDDRNIDDHPPPSLLCQYDGSPQRIVNYSSEDHDRDPLRGQDRRRCKYVHDDHGRHQDNRLESGATSQEGSRVLSKSPPQSNFRGSIGAVYQDPYEGVLPIHPRPLMNPGNHGPSRNLQRPRWSCMPPKKALVFPGPSSSQHERDPDSWQRQPNAGHLSPPPPKDDLDDVTARALVVAHRRSTHRREPGYDFSNPYQPALTSLTLPSAVEYSGLPLTHTSSSDAATMAVQAVQYDNSCRHDSNDFS